MFNEQIIWQNRIVKECKVLQSIRIVELKSEKLDEKEF